MYWQRERYFYNSIINLSCENRPHKALLVYEAPFFGGGTRQQILRLETVADIGFHDVYSLVVGTTLGDDEVGKALGGFYELLVHGL